MPSAIVADAWDEGRRAAQAALVGGRGLGSMLDRHASGIQESIMTSHHLIVAVFAHPILFTALCSTLLALGLAGLAFHTCACEECGKPFGIFRVREHSLELCYKCFRLDRPMPSHPTEAPGSRATDKARKVRSA